jgi:hypothetical protein
LNLYDLGQWNPLRSASMEPIEGVRVRHSSDLPERAAVARDALLHELRQLEPRGADLIWNVVCLGCSCREWAIDKGCDPRYAMERLRECLTILG